MAQNLFRYKTKSGYLWGVKLKLKGPDGIWRRKTWRGFSNKFDANTFLDQQKDERYRERFFPGSPRAIKVREYFELWLKSYAAHHCKYSTLKSYILTINKYLLPKYGERQLNSLTIHDMKELCSLLQSQNKARQTIRNIFLPIREGLGHAVAEGLILSNPCMILRRQLKQTRDAKITRSPLTQAETLTLVAGASKKEPVLHAAILLGVRAGMRAGEVLGLQWGDVDLKNRTATIRHTIVLARQTDAKNKRARTVDLTPSVVQALRNLPIGKPTDRIIQRHERGVCITWLRLSFYDVLKECGLPQITFHALRHTYASQLILLGANPKYIQDQLGHASINVTFDIYGHLFKNERSADLLEAAPSKVAVL